MAKSHICFAVGKLWYNFKNLPCVLLTGGNPEVSDKRRKGPTMAALIFSEYCRQHAPCFRSEVNRFPKGYFAVPS